MIANISVRPCAVTEGKSNRNKATIIIFIGDFGESLFEFIFYLFSICWSNHWRYRMQIWYVWIVNEYKFRANLSVSLKNSNWPLINMLFISTVHNEWHFCVWHTPNGEWILYGTNRGTDIIQFFWLIFPSTPCLQFMLTTTIIEAAKIHAHIYLLYMLYGAVWRALEFSAIYIYIEMTVEKKYINSLSHR